MILRSAALLRYAPNVHICVVNLQKSPHNIAVVAKTLSRCVYRFIYSPRHLGPQYKVCSFQDFKSKPYFVMWTNTFINSAFFFSKAVLFKIKLKIDTVQCERNCEHFGGKFCLHLQRTCLLFQSEVRNITFFRRLYCIYYK